MSKHSKTNGFLRSLRLAWQAIIYSWKTQKHMKFHVLAGLIVIFTAWLAQITRLEWLMLVFAIGCVIAAEMMNTAIELVVDLAEPHFHPLAGLAKDVASGAVLITAIQAIVIGAIVFWPYLMRQLAALKG